MGTSGTYVYYFKLNLLPTLIIGHQHIQMLRNFQAPKFEPTAYCNVEDMQTIYR